MNIIYFMYSLLLMASYGVFAYWTIVWVERWRKGSKYLKEDMESETRALIRDLRDNARHQAICWLTITCVTLYAYMDCLHSALKGGF